MPLPKTNGQVLPYHTVVPLNWSPRIYYVNGIQTDAATHARTATGLSILTERVVHGVYNATAGIGAAGFVVDFPQCGADWTDVFLSKLAELGNSGLNKAINGVLDFVAGKRGHADPVNVAESIRRRIPEAHRVAIIERCVSTYNKATASLFRELRTNVSNKQIIIAHSQGNLITADALWSMVIAYGESSLEKMQVYSLASPAPAWPVGLRYRRKVYGHTDDVVTLFDPHNWTWITSRLADGKFGRTAGDWRKFGSSWPPSAAGHDVRKNIALNFATTIRKDLVLCHTCNLG